MKLIINKSPDSNYSNEYTQIQDINLVDMFCDDAEAVEIIVDNFLSTFTYQDVGNVVNKICSKIRLGGKITIIDKDIEMLNHMLTFGKIDIDLYNQHLFSDGPVNCVYTVDIILDLLKSMSLKITEVYMENNSPAIILKAERC